MKKVINTFLSEEIGEILKAINEFDPINSLNRRCAICGEIIAVDNIYSISKKEGKYIYICNNPECIKQKEG